MLRKFKKFALGLFGIDAIIQKGTPYIIFEEWGEIITPGSVNVTGINAQNITMSRQPDGQFAIRPVQNDTPF